MAAVKAMGCKRAGHFSDIRPGTRSEVDELSARWFTVRDARLLIAACFTNDVLRFKKIYQIPGIRRYRVIVAYSS
jgi:hypothetical protein